MTNRKLGEASGTELIVLLLAINALNMVDRNLLGIVAGSLKSDMGLTDTHIGLLGGLFFSLVYALGGLPLGKLADRGFARPTVAGAVALWSAMTTLSGFAQAFWHLAITRLGVAAGEAALAPAATAIISKTYPENRRSLMIGIYSMGVPLGFLLAYALGGWLVERVGWRLTFILVGLPGLVFALLAWLRLPPNDPAETQGKEVLLGKTLRYLWSKPSFRHTVAGSSLFSVVGYSMATFLPLAMMNAHGVGAAEVGLWLGLIAGFSGIVGMPLSGWLADWVSGRGASLRLVLAGLLMAVSAPFFAGALFADSLALAMILLFVPYMLTFAYLGPMIAAMHSIVPQHMRAMTSSAVYAALTLFGAALGPVAVGWLSDRLLPLYGDDSLVYALLLLPVALVWSALHFFLGARKLEADIYRDEV